MSRKIVQIAASKTYYVVALADDGTVWALEHSVYKPFSRWRKLPPIPQESPDAS